MLIRTALEHQRAGRVDEAIAALMDAWKINPQATEAGDQLRNLLRHAGRPDSADHYNQAGFRAITAGDLARAIAEFRTALCLEPSLVSARSNLAVALQGSGRSSEAIAEFEAVVRLQPNHPGSYGNLGTALHSAGRFDDAIACLQKAIALDPNLVDAHNCLGLSLKERGRIGEAVVAYRAVLRLRPDSPDTMGRLGAALRELGRFDESIDVCRAALRLKPDAPYLHNLLGAALLERGRRRGVPMPQNESDEVIACFQTAVRLKPDFIDAYSNLGVALKASGRHDESLDAHRAANACRFKLALKIVNAGDRHRFAEAEAALLEILRDQPDHAGTHANLGNIRFLLQKYEAAVTSYRQAIQLAPNLAEAHNSLGSALRELNRVDEAVVCLRRATELRPEYAEAHNGIGAALISLGRFSESIVSFRRAVAIKGDYADAHMNLGYALLATGDFAAGWPEWEWRLRGTGATKPLKTTHPEWDGSPLAGRTILIRAEQGLGDAVQFVRYARMVKSLGGTVVAECLPQLMTLFAQSNLGIDRLIVRDQPPPPFDVHISMMSLPHRLGTNAATIPADVPYLRADEATINHWRRVLPAGRLRVGIVWQGSHDHPNDLRRSVPLRAFAPLVSIEEIQLVSLQKGPGTGQIAEAGGEIPLFDAGSRVSDMADTAAVIAALDLVVSVDTSVVHVAGAMGIPVWVALPFTPDWRWMLDRTDSPWYPTMRLFRQEKAGDWSAVFQQIASALRAGGVG